jgi:hypothetical protein
VMFMINPNGQFNMFQLIISVIVALALIGILLSIIGLI